MDIDNTMIVQKSRCSKLAGQIIPKPDGKVADTLKEWLRGAPVEDVKPVQVPTTQAAPASESKPAETPAASTVDYQTVYKAGKSKGLWSAANGFYAFASHVLNSNVNDKNVKNLAKPNLENLLSAIEAAESIKQTAQAS